jgi:hypothetical protein
MTIENMNVPAMCFIPQSFDNYTANDNGNKPEDARCAEQELTGCESKAATDTALHHGLTTFS